MDGGNLAHNLEGQQRTSDVVLRELTPFGKMLLAPSVRKGLQQAGFVYPTIIQATAVPVGKSGLDLLVQSKSGTGKTLIFSIILLEAYDPHVVEPQSLIVTPTREIAVQIESVLNVIGHHCNGFSAVSVIGGLDISEDRKRLLGAKAVVGTPGRLLHVIQNNVLNTARIKLFVLDEADKLYTQSFRQDLQRIQKALPTQRQTIACSATFCGDLDKELAKIMQNPLLISTEQRATLLVGIKQFTYELPGQKTSILEMQSKLDALRDIFGRIPFKQCLIFAGSQSRANSYRNYLEKDGWPCDLISGAQNQRTRLEVFRKFREFKTRIILATDLMSRGVDSEHVNLVINLELPTDVVTYLHRIGRAGRFGSHGIAISFIASEKDHGIFKRLISEVGCGMNVLKFPHKSELDEKYDFWNFDDIDVQCQHFDLFDQESHASLTDTQENKDNKTDNLFNSNASIETNILKIDTKDSVIDGLLDRTEEILQPDSKQSSLEQLTSSKTIDIASSYVVNSEESSQQEASSEDQTILMQKPTISLLDFLVDKRAEDNEKATDGRKKGKTPVNVYEDYRNSVPHNEQKSSEESTKIGQPQLTARKIFNLKSLLIDEPQKDTNNTIVCKQKHLYSDYANFDENNDVCSRKIQNTVAHIGHITKNPVLHPVEIASVEHDCTEELQNSSADLSQFGSIADSPPEKQRFPSPNLKPDEVLPNPDVKAQNIFINVEAQIEMPPRQPNGILPSVNVELLNNEIPPPQPNVILPSVHVEPLSREDTTSPSSSESLRSLQEVLGSGSSTERGGGAASSGFNENTTSASSGIETSDAEGDEEDWDECNDDESSGSESENESCDYERTLNGEEYTESSEDDDSEKTESGAPKGAVSKNSVNKTASQATSLNNSMKSDHSEANQNSAAYQIAYEHWVETYKQQVAILQDYVKLCAQVQQQQGEK